MSSMEECRMLEREAVERFCAKHEFVAGSTFYYLGYELLITSLGGWPGVYCEYRADDGTIKNKDFTTNDLGYLSEYLGGPRT